MTDRENVTVIDLDAETVPEAPATKSAPVETHKVVLSLPTELHDRLAAVKTLTKRSVNAMLRDAITNGKSIDDIEADARTAGVDALAEAEAKVAALRAAAARYAPVEAEVEATDEGTTPEA